MNYAALVFSCIHFQVDSVLYDIVQYIYIYIYIYSIAVLLSLLKVRLVFSADSILIQMHLPQTV